MREALTALLALLLVAPGPAMARAGASGAGGPAMPPGAGAHVRALGERVQQRIGPGAARTWPGQEAQSGPAGRTGGAQGRGAVCPDCAQTPDGPRPAVGKEPKPVDVVTRPNRPGPAPGCPEPWIWWEGRGCVLLELLPDPRKQRGGAGPATGSGD